MKNKFSNFIEDKIKAEFIKIQEDKFIINIEKNKYIFIFDEVHRCSNLESDNCKLMLSIKNVMRAVVTTVY